MTRKPNIVFFFTDQLRRDALGCYGNKICQTPNLDRLAAQGVQFENAFTVSPVCSPARASLMTGLYPHNHGVMLNTHIAPTWNHGLSPDIPTFSRILKQAGYALDYIGKWHVHQDMSPLDFGFDRYEQGAEAQGIIAGSGITIDCGTKQHLVVAGTNRVSDTEAIPWKTTQRGIDMMRERVRTNRPFFLRIDLGEPHFTCCPPEPYASMYNPASIPPWANFAEDFHNKPDGHLRKHKEWHLEDKKWDWWSQVIAKYYGVVSYIDTCVGQVVAAIEDLGISDQTILLFCTDHGDALGSHRHFEKAGTMYDEIFRIPLLVKGPQTWVAPGKVDAFVRSLDLMPTFVEWSGASLPKPVDGRSLASWMRGEKTDAWPDSVYCEHHGEVWGYESQRMVRTLRWKYVYNPHSKDELYNLQDDPAELINHADDPHFYEVLQEMKARLLGWNDATSDMFQWTWVRWNFPDPVLPDRVSHAHLPMTASTADQ